MSLNKTKIVVRIAFALVLCFFVSLTYVALARVGGGGGHSSGGHSSGGHSGGSHRYSGRGHSHGYRGGGNYSGGGSWIILFTFVVFIIIIFAKFQDKKDVSVATNDQGPSSAFPPGLDANKVANAFFAIQDAWQQKNLGHVRKWLSDGMYQKLTTQFKMMRLLDQKNMLSNIRVARVRSGMTRTDGDYQTVDMAITFSMDDRFVSEKYPQFNESYQGDADVEYWTFIKRIDSKPGRGLYDDDQCPNCGAPLEIKMGEISRCASCHTLTNSAVYDWVLSEITQNESYRSGAGLANDMKLKDIVKDDPYFAVQRMEDIASNIFMQVMEVLSFDDEKRLSRFSDERTIAIISSLKQSLPQFLFDRLYLDSVDMAGYSIEGDIIRLLFSIKANYRRVTGVEASLQLMDRDFVTRPCSIELSRSVKTIAKTAETVLSYECSACGAPFNDTTEDKCTYCDAPVVDKERDWVLTGFVWG